MKFKLYKHEKKFKSINNTPINNNPIIENKPVKVIKPVIIIENKPIIEEINNDWDFLDKVIYINLEHRKDRLKQIQNELNVIPSHKIIRFNAIKDTEGHIGCSKSHIACLELAIQNNWKNVLIVEDDMIWNNYENNIKLLHTLLNNNWDVISLGNYNVEYDVNTYKLFYGICSQAYIVNNNYFKKLKENYEYGLLKLIEGSNYDKSEKIKNNNKYCLDRYWEILMKNDNWYIIMPNLCNQRPSFSNTINSFRARVHK
jgi:glycosyl transferase family 25